MKMTPLIGSAKIPQLGFGTFRLKGPKGKEAVKCAIKAGYRHIDTAHMYKNEDIIGIAIKESVEEGVINSRDELFITSKLHRSDFDKYYFKKIFL